MASKYLLSSDDDVLAKEPRLEDIWPRFNDDGSIRYDWEIHHRAAANYIERRLRATKAVPERFQLGRLSPRSQEDLSEAATCFTLSYIFRAADTQGDQAGYYDRKCKYYEAAGVAAFTDAALLLDYDVDNSGDFGSQEQQQPFPIRMIRG